MERAPEVSVIVAAHDAAPTIEHALRSALEADGPPIEILVADDASRDDTVARVRALGDPRVRLLASSATNAGPAAARNRALAEARGTWLALLDADDWFAAGRLAALVAAATESGADLLADNLFYAATPAEVAWRTLFSPREVPHPRWVDATSFVAWNTPGDRGPRLGLLKPLIRRTFLERHGLRWDERFRYGEDFLLYAQCLLQGARFRLLPEARYGYRAQPRLGARRRSAHDLEGAVLANHMLLAAARTAGDSGLVSALELRDAALVREVTYRFTLELADRRQWGRLLAATVRDPRAAMYVADRARQAVARRLLLRRREPGEGR